MNFEKRLNRALFESSRSTQDWAEEDWVKQIERKAVIKFWSDDTFDIHVIVPIGTTVIIDEDRSRSELRWARPQWRKVNDGSESPFALSVDIAAIACARVFDGTAIDLQDPRYAQMYFDRSGGGYMVIYMNGQFYYVAGLNASSFWSVESRNIMPNAKLGFALAKMFVDKFRDIQRMSNDGAKGFQAMLSNIYSKIDHESVSERVCDVFERAISL